MPCGTGGCTIRVSFMIFENTAQEALSLPKLLCTKSAALQLGISYRTLEDWRLTGDGPPFLKIGRSVRYRISDILVFLHDRVRSNTAVGGI